MAKLPACQKSETSTCLFLMKKPVCKTMPGALAGLSGHVAHGRLLNLSSTCVSYWLSAWSISLAA